MPYSELCPSRSLADAVECIWLLEEDRRELDGRLERLLPDGTVELILHFGEPFEELRGDVCERQARTLLAGPTQRPLLLRPSRHARVLGVRFRPGGAHGLLGLPLQELSDRLVALDDLGSGSKLLRESALTLIDEGWTSSSILLKRTETMLRRSLEPPDLDRRLIERAVARLLASRGQRRIRDLATDLGVGQRRLERLFRAYVGLPAKRYARVVRFQSIFRVLHQTPEESWSGVAHECGYADQAHLANEFRALSGLSPNAYLAETHTLADRFTAEDRLERLFRV